MFYDTFHEGCVLSVNYEITYSENDYDLKCRREREISHPRKCYTFFEGSALQLLPYLGCRHCGEMEEWNALLLGIHIRDLGFMSSLL